MSYSNGGGGTLTLPSPTHVHHIDVSSTVRSLRRSLSRSPSKFQLVRKSPSASPKSPLSPTPASPSKRIFSAPNLSGNPPHTPSPLAMPYPPSAKLALRSSSRAKPAPPRPRSGNRTSPKSPMRRALSHASDTGNAPPNGASGYMRGQENSRIASPAEPERRSFERMSKMAFNLDVPAPINHALSRLGGDGAMDCHTSSSTSSPLKRSDAIMNLDQASLGSPVAKRRSLHGSASFGHDFNVFDHGPSSSPHFDIHDDSNHEYELSTASITSDNSYMPRRSSSLRKSTLQQRHGEKTSWGRRHAAQLLAAQQAALTPAPAPETSTPNRTKDRPRLSLDQFMPPQPRDSPFTSHGSLPNASMHLMNPPTHQPHPLSRTMTTSSSSSSLMEDSPPRIPVNFSDNKPRPKLDFSKSLPAGAMRPFAFDVTSEGGSFNTPQNYKHAKPLQQAFASTGLISKVNRNPEQLPITRGLGKSNVPDTPCKKHVAGAFATYPAPVPGSAIAKARHIRHSFGTPSTPFNPHGTPIQNVFGKGTGVFGSTFGMNRRGSFVSVEDDNGGSPDAKGDSQNGLDFDLPPTPTKSTLIQHNGSPSAHKSVPMSAVGNGFRGKLLRTSSKLNLLTSSGDQSAEDSDDSVDMMDSPTVPNRSLPRMDMMASIPRFTTLRALRLDAPTPSLPQSLTTSLLLSPSYKPGFTKVTRVAPASPLERIDFIERRSPQTPQDLMVPPDPSGLSISAKSNANLSTMAPPATPTAGRDYFSVVGDRKLSTTPISGFAPGERDDSLNAKFEKVEMIGTGEFSFVYRVTQRQVPFNQTASMFSTTPSGSPVQGRTPPTPMPQRVFAVKKSRQPYQGIRDRQRKLQEVEVLRALGQSDHVVHLIDSWEESNFLYIQTEFCEEGSLDTFLNNVGRKGRLDDFRIWKILIELGLGLRHIHESGYIHLDLKPANVLITFEGVLKIADFGMATTYPTQPGIEGEGDREYIGPEILLGSYDKPADVFALGLIMFEIAGNVRLPDNGPSWQKLRSGDISDVPSLTWSSDDSVQRDATGIPMEPSDLSMDNFSDDELEPDYGSPSMSSRKRNVGNSSKSLSHDPGNLFGSMRRGELHRAPRFMQDMHHEHALDNVVRWMISPNPQDRPMIQQVLQTGGVQWVDGRRRAGATVYEGNWGPSDAVLKDEAARGGDTEMTGA